MALSKPTIRLFFGRQDFLSNWYPAMFVLDDTRYNCSEQRYMHKKALTFGDHDTAERIMRSKEPKTQKFLGRRVRNFDQRGWDLVKENIMYEANYAKFSQNQELGNKLRLTGCSILAEASPYDRIFGIGFSATDPRAMKMSQWKGQNLLGKILMKVRTALV